MVLTSHHLVRIQCNRVPSPLPFLSSSTQATIRKHIRTYPSIVDGQCSGDACFVNKQGKACDRGYVAELLPGLPL